MALSFIPIQPLPSSDEPRLPAHYVRKLRQDHQYLVTLAAELPARIAEAEKRLAAAMLFAPDNLEEDAQQVSKNVQAPKGVPEQLVLDTSTKAVARKGRRVKSAGEALTRSLTWISEVDRVLQQASRGLTHSQLRDELRNSKIEAMASAGDKGFYNAIARLTKQGRLVKSGGLLYSAAFAFKFTQEGKALPNAPFENKRKHGGSAALIIDALYDYEEGCTANELRTILAENPDAPKSLRDHGQYIYNILANTIGAGDVAKLGEKYILTESRRFGMDELRAMND